MNTRTNQINISDYRTIPGYHSRYMVNEQGVMINTERNNAVLSPSPSGNGYRTYYIKTDTGINRLLSRHRAMMLAWRYPDGQDPSTLQVNHINGIAGDDRLDNLEWCTPSQNIQHSIRMGLRGNVRTVETRDINTGVVVNYPSALECARRLGMSKDGISVRCGKGDTKVWPEGLQFRFTTDKPWYIPTESEIANATNTYGRGRSVAVHKLLTNETLAFETLTEAADYLGVCLTTLYNQVNTPGCPTNPGYYQVVYLDSDTKFRYPSDPYLDLEESWPNDPTRHVVVINTETNELSICFGLKAAATLAGVNYTTAHMRFKQSKNRKFGKFIIEYYSEFIRVSSISDYTVNVL